MESLTKMFGIEECIVPEGFTIDRYTEMEFDFEKINNIRAEKLVVSEKFLNELL